MKKVCAFLTLAGLVVTGCSGSTADNPSDGGNPSGTDASTADTSVPINNGPDGGSADTGSSDSSTPPQDVQVTPFDAALPGQDAGLPQGTLLVPGGGQYLDGVTSDGFIIFDDGNGTVSAIPLAAASGDGGVAEAGAGKVQVGTTGPNADISVHGGAVFLWTDPDQNTYVSPLSIWTSAAGLQALATSSLDGQATISSDGAYILYANNVNVAGDTGDIVLAKSDGTAKVTLAQGVSVTGDCSVFFRFVSGDHVVGSYCTAADAAAGLATVSSFTVPAGTKTDLVYGANSAWGTDGTGTNVFVVVNGTGEVVPVAGGPATPIDTSVSSGTLTSDGSAALYRTTTGALKRSARGHG
jgi:hypothetical protein